MVPPRERACEGPGSTKAHPAADAEAELADWHLLLPQEEKESDKRRHMASSGLFPGGGGGGRVLRDPKDCDWPTYSSEYLGASAWLRTWNQMYLAILAHPSPAFRVPHCFYALKDNFTHCTASRKAKYHCKLL